MWANSFASKEQKELLGAKKGKEVADHQNLQQASAVSVNDNSKEKSEVMMWHFSWPQLSVGEGSWKSWSWHPSGVLVDITSSVPVVASSSLGYFLSHQTALCVGDLVFLCYRSNWSHISEGTKALCGRTRLRQVRLKVLQTKRNVLHLYWEVSGKC